MDTNIHGFAVGGHLIKHGHIFVGTREVLGGANSESKDKMYVLVIQQVHGTSGNDQEDTRTDVLMSDGEVNTTNMNAAIEDMMTSSLKAR